MRGRAFRGPVLLFAGLTMTVGAAGGQDIEMAAQAVGRALPPGYFERVQQQPDFFRIKGGWIARTARAVEAGEELSGTLPVAVILALFADSPEPHVTSAAVQGALFDGPSPYGTVTEYYDEVSGGRLQVTGQSFPWVRTSFTMDEVVGDSYGLGEDVQTGPFLLEAVAAADSMIDFGLFDNDGPDGIPNSGDDDGQVDAVAIQFLEVAASCGGPSIWPHRSRLRYWNDDTPFVSNDPGANGSPILVNDYTTQGATDCGGQEVQKATTIAHELGHVLGLPDLYDRSQGLAPEDRRWVVGCWSLMAAGSWGCGTSNRVAWVRPTHLGAWEKERLGWLSGIEEVGIGLDHVFTLEPVRASEQVLKIPLQRDVPADSAEYLLIEYRTREGFDADIPASGVLVYHVSPRIGGNQPCDTCPQVYRVGLLEADGNNSLRLNFLQGGNRGEPGDAWGVSGPGRLTNSTHPSTRLNSGAPSAVTIYEVSVDGGAAHLTLSSGIVATSRLVQSFLGTSAVPLTSQEEEYLDSHGNWNGQYDVGDLRAYLRR
ncbi:M6 family metalloprotease domain-containing protein [Gemmatimonadota bacterium]